LDKFKSLALLRGRWAKVDTRQRDFQSISAYYRESRDTRSNSNLNTADVDDRTWADLDMDLLFSKLDRTFTAAGEGALYQVLRTPCLNLEELSERRRVISLFQKDQDLREKIQLVFLKQGRRDSSEIVRLLWGELPPENRWLFAYNFMAIVALCSLFTPFLWGLNAALIIPAVFSINSYIHYRANKKYSVQLPSISSLGALLRTARKIARMRAAGLEGWQQKLKTASAATQKILRKTRFLNTYISGSDLDIFYEYMKILFLLEVRCFYGALREIKNEIAHLRTIYRVLGMLDALQSVASYRESLEDYTEPELVSEGVFLRVKDIRHPLLENPVPNSVTLDKEHASGIIITGSNMSGKSTFLKTIGINAILAQTIYTCCAGSYRASFFQIVSSMSKMDDLAQGKSFYYLEAERLLKIVNLPDTKVPALCLIDELLAGTNYAERLSASEAILHFLSRKNVLVVVATHDLDLPEKLEGFYHCCHFTDQVDRYGLNFDYTLKEGVATTRNAIKLLEYLGYPHELVERARGGVL
ncbi:MAG: MutS-related protein, partial [Dethiobacteria bacterium]